MTTKKTTSVEKKRKTLIQAATRKLSSSKKRCPRCGKTKQIAAFGWRTMESDSRGLPLVVRPQSYCAECRGH
jgi:ribosomal protein S27AE